MTHVNTDDDKSMWKGYVSRYLSTSNLMAATFNIKALEWINPARCSKGLYSSSVILVQVSCDL